MALEYAGTDRMLPRDGRRVTIRRMTRDDFAAVRRFSDGEDATVGAGNLKEPPGYENSPGGPWSEDALLAEHFGRYERAGNLSLLAVDGTGRVAGMADLWKTHEPEPFGPSLDVEYIEATDEYFVLGLEEVLLEEAEKVARAAGIPSLDIGTNTAEGSYNHLRHFGFRVFYEYDAVLCGCGEARGNLRPARRMLKPSELNPKGLIKVDHWCPTDCFLEAESERGYIAELAWPDHRAVLELFGTPAGDRYQPVPPAKPVRTRLSVEPASLVSSDRMSAILGECAALAGEAGARELALPCPADVALDPRRVDVIQREYMFAWLRKKIASEGRT